MRAGLRRLARRRRADGHDRRHVARLDRVVHQPGALRPLLRAQRRDHGRVELPAPDRRQAVLDRAAGELVAEGDAVGAVLEHAGGLRLGQRLEARAEQRGGEVEIDVPGDHRQLVERLAALGAEPADARQHGLHHADRDGVAGRGQRLGHEERVAAGHAVQGVRVGAGAGRQLAHRRARQRPQREPVHGAAGEHAEEAVQRVAGVDVVVAAGEHEQRADALDPPRRVAEHVERGVVGPVQVLDDEHGGGSAPSSSSSAAEHGVDRLPVGQRRGERAAAAGAASRSGPSVRGAIRSSQAETSTRARSRGGGGEGAHQASSCRSRPRRSPVRPSRARRPRRRRHARAPRACDPARAADGHAPMVPSRAARGRGATVRLRRARPGPRRS